MDVFRQKTFIRSAIIVKCRINFGRVGGCGYSTSDCGVVLCRMPDGGSKVKFIGELADAARKFFYNLIKIKLLLALSDQYFMKFAPPFRYIALQLMESCRFSWGQI